MPLFDPNAWRREQENADSQYAQNLFMAAMQNRQQANRQQIADQDFQQRLYMQQMQAKLAEQAAQQEYLRRLGLMDVQQQYGQNDAYQQQQFGIDRMKLQNQFAQQAGAADYSRELEKLGITQGYNVDNQQLQDELLRGRMGMEQQFGLERAAYDDQLRAGQNADQFDRDMTKMQFGEIADAEAQRRAAMIDQARMSQQNQFTMQRDAQQNMYSQQEGRTAFLRQQFGQIKQAVGQIGQQSARFNAEGKPKWDKIKQKLATLDDAYRKGQLREDLYLEEYARVGNEIQTEPWAQYVQSQGSLPGDVVYRGQWEYLKGPDGKLSEPVLRQDWSHDQHAQYHNAQTMTINDPMTGRPMIMQVPKGNGTFESHEIRDPHEFTVENYLKLKQAADNYNAQNTDNEGNPIPGRQITVDDLMTGFLTAKDEWNKRRNPQQTPPPNGAPVSGPNPAASGQARADAYGQAIQAVDPNAQAAGQQAAPNPQKQLQEARSVIDAITAYYKTPEAMPAQAVDALEKAQEVHKQITGSYFGAGPRQQLSGFEGFAYGTTGGVGLGLPQRPQTAQDVQRKHEEAIIETERNAALKAGKREMESVFQDAKRTLQKITKQYPNGDIPDELIPIYIRAKDTYRLWGGAR